MNHQMDRFIQYKSLNRHYDPDSEEFTGVDSLLSLLHQGWQIIDYRMDTSYACVTQKVVIHIFDLHLANDYVRMKVIANPYIERLLTSLSISKKLGAQ